MSDDYVMAAAMDEIHQTTEDIWQELLKVALKGAELMIDMRRARFAEEQRAAARQIWEDRQRAEPLLRAAMEEEFWEEFDPEKVQASWQAANEWASSDPRAQAVWEHMRDKLEEKGITVEPGEPLPDLSEALELGDPANEAANADLDEAALEGEELAEAALEGEELAEAALEGEELAETALEGRPLLEIDPRFDRPGFDPQNDVAIWKVVEPGTPEAKTAWELDDKQAEAASAEQWSRALETAGEISDPIERAAAEKLVLDGIEKYHGFHFDEGADPAVVRDSLRMALDDAPPAVAEEQPSLDNAIAASQLDDRAFDEKSKEEFSQDEVEINEAEQLDSPQGPHTPQSEAHKEEAETQEQLGETDHNLSEISHDRTELLKEDQRIQQQSGPELSPQQPAERTGSAEAKVMNGRAEAGLATLGEQEQKSASLGNRDFPSRLKLSRQDGPARGQSAEGQGNGLGALLSKAKGKVQGRGKGAGRG